MVFTVFFTFEYMQAIISLREEIFTDINFCLLIGHINLSKNSDRMLDIRFILHPVLYGEIGTLDGR